eukprot:Clim_evm69s119 gene=Clim_evmTU69s119
MSGNLRASSPSKGKDKSHRHGIINADDIEAARCALWRLIARRQNGELGQGGDLELGPKKDGNLAGGIAAKELLLGLLVLLKRQILVSTLWYSVQIFSTLATPITIYLILLWLEDDSRPTYEGYLLCIILLTLATASNYASGRSLKLSLQAGVKSRHVMNSMIFHQLLDVSVAGESTSSGEVTGLVSSSTENLTNFWNGCVGLLLQPLEALAIIIELIYFVNYAAVGALVVVMISMSAANILGRRLETEQSRRSEMQRKRNTFLSEALHGMGVIKANAWENKFKEKLQKFRVNEVKSMRKSYFQSGLLIASSNNSVDWISLAVAAFYVFIISKPLEPAITWTYWILLGILHGRIFYLPLNVKTVADGFSAFRQITEFLNRPKSVHRLKNVLEGDGSGVNVMFRLENANVCWNPLVSDEASIGSNSSCQRGLVRELTFDIRKREMTVIVGPAAAGKTTLLMGLMDEIFTQNVYRASEVTSPGSIGYASQHPFILRATIRDNIVMGRPFKLVRYNDVVAACGLLSDFEDQENGDLTFVSPTTLSGGQKQRIALARCIYNENHSVYIFDCPISALDPHVANHVIHVIFTALLKHKTVVCATNHPSLISAADQVIVLNRDGSLDKVMDDGADESILAAIEAYEKGPVEDDIQEEVGEDSLFLDEEKGGGTRKMGEWSFVKAALGSTVHAIWLAFWVLFEMAGIEASMVTLALWSERTDTITRDEEYLFLAVYSAFIVVETSAVVVRFKLYSKWMVSSNQRLFTQLLTAVFAAPASYICEVTPNWTLSLFVGSLQKLEKDLMMNFDMFYMAASFIVLLTVLMLIVSFWFVLVVVPVLGLMVLVGRRYGSTIGRLTLAKTKTAVPFTNVFSETWTGLISIRACAVGDYMMSQFKHYLDAHIDVDCKLMNVQSKLVERGRFIGILYYFGVTLVVVGLKGDVNASRSGFFLANACFSSLVVNLLITTRLELEVMNQARMRVLKFINSAPREDRNIDEYDTKLLDRLRKEKWPKQGELVLDHVWMRYEESLPHVLKDINLHIRPGENIGIVGRTGAGKSSLMAVLSRLAQVDYGCVLLDGVNINSIPLTQLRSCIAVITQDALFFSGTVRKNLDPFDEFDDLALVRRLEDVGVMDANGFSLDTKVEENGRNISAGQKQLVCLARAMLHQPSVIVMDEVTSHVDPTTEQLISTALRTYFADSTVIQIAHRLHTVVDCDRIAVMVHGEIAEFDTPLALIERQSGLFRRMSETLGPREFEKLRDVARKSMHTGTDLDNLDNLRWTA